jgi:hypothetical protein
MQFFRMRDEETQTWHNYLIVQLSEEEFESLKSRFDTQVIKLTCNPVVRNGKPYVVFDYGGAVNLSEAFSSGETLSDKLQVGDIVTVILTDQPQSQLLSQEDGTVKLNFDMAEIIAYPFTYSKEMEQLYEFYRIHSNLKSSERQLKVKRKTKKLSFR